MQSFGICLNLQRNISFLDVSGSSLNSKAPCMEKARLPASIIALGKISQDPLPRVDILWLNC